MVKKLVNRTEFAKLAGVSGAAVTKACSKALKPACSGKRIDAAHPSAVSYIENRSLAQTPPAAIGLDPFYEEAVENCQKTNCYSGASIQRKFKIGYNRATKIVQTMRANGLIPEQSKKIPDVVIEPPKKSHVRGTAAAKAAKKRELPQELSEGTIEIPQEIEAFLNWTLLELIDKFGTDTRFVDWLAATQKIEAINEKRLKNAQTKGVLISRSLVKSGVIDVFNSAHLRLLKDGAKSIAAGVISKHSAGAELSEVEAYVSDILGSFIKPIKSKISRILKNA